MSQDFMDPEIFSDFIIEAREHLQTIEPALLELEKNPGNLGLLNDIFRPMHSLKGASGFLGLLKINGLAHKAENILDDLRNGKMAATTEIMDVILAATDTLTSLIDNLDKFQEEGQVDTTGIIAHIEALMNGSALIGQATQEVAEAAAAVQSASAAAQEKQQPVAQVVTIPEEPLEPFDPTPYSLTIIAEGHLHDFLDEAGEIVEAIGAALIVAEKDPSNSSFVNDLFRYYHNLKGNCGIIGFSHLGALTHEAESLLGMVRKGELTLTSGHIDLLLTASDMMAECLAGVDAESGKATPVDTRMMLSRLRRATAGEIPATVQPAPAPTALVVDAEEAVVFRQTVEHQFNNITLALRELAGDSSQRALVDGLFRCLTTIQNSSEYMHFVPVRDLAKRTAGLVDQARNSDLDFSLLLPILEQECDILRDEVNKKIVELESGAQATNSPEATPPEVVVEAPSAPVKQAEPAPVKSVPPAAPTVQAQPVRAPEASAKASAPAVPAKAQEPAAVQPAAPQAGEDKAAKGKGGATIRVDHEKLDHLMNVIGELIINRNRFAMIAKSLEEGRMDVVQVAQHLTETTDAMARISDDLQDTIMKVRMVPMSTVFSRFPRLVRDLSRKSGKEVELITEGEETELDKSLVEEIGDPLVHLIRNSVDHGLETADERRAAGKPEIGRVWLRAYHKGNSVAIEVEDDGRGIDPEKMRRSAVKKGLMSEEAARALDDREAIEIIFAPGFSTAEQVTDISGRGVGMDVVRTNIKNLKGTVNVHSELGKGTRFTLSLPLTLAIIDALMVKVGDDTYAIPLDAVSETTKVESRRLTDVAKRKAMTLRDEVLGVVELGEMLGLPRDGKADDILPMVVIHDNERRLGLVVDKLLERQEIVIKPLGAYLGNYDLRGVSGATILGDGSVVLILDPHEIYSMATSASR